MVRKEKLLIVANWKANPDSRKLALSILAGTKKAAAGKKHADVVVCPPTLYLESLRSAARPLALGAQDIFTEPNGAFTGSIGYEALRETGIRYVIIGHSERRAAGETDADVNKKLRVALSIGLTPILCVGEAKREGLGYLAMIKSQIIMALKDIPKTRVRDLVIAYEPVWAIGKDAARAARPDEVAEVVMFAKRVIGDLYKTNSVPPVRIIYGASVDAGNAANIVAESGVDGLLVGRASLAPKAFAGIIAAINDIS